MNVIKAILLVATGMYLAILFLAWLFQSRMIFFPEQLAAAHRFLPEGTEVWIPTADGIEINGLFFKGTRPEVILYLHGNAGSLNSWQHVGIDLNRKGFSVLLIDYRGFGKSKGTLSEAGLYHDAHAAMEFLNKRYAAGNIIVFGRSIGTGIAVELCTHYGTKGLVLESAYSSLTSLAKEKLPWLLPRIILQFRLPSIDRIANIKCPVLFIHGDQDTLIPPESSALLFDACPGRKARFVIPGGGHNDLSHHAVYHQILETELDKLFQ